MSILLLIFIICAILCFFVILKNNEKDPDEKVSLPLGIFWCIIPIWNIFIICFGIGNLYVLSREKEDTPNIFEKANDWFMSGGKK